MNEKLSTSALAKRLKVDSKTLFTRLKHAGYLAWHDDSWLITDLGYRFGGEYVDSEKYGRFVVWPCNLIIDENLVAGGSLSATQIGERFSLAAKKVNLLLAELGWIQRSDTGWKATLAGVKAGGQQKIDKASEQHFVVWHHNITRNERLKQSVIEFQGSDAESHSTDKSFSSFKQKFSAKHRTLDGHYVKSKGELIIDNWLYMAGVAHAYERQLPIEEDMICDFYLPAGNVYLQFWGDDSGSTDDKVKQRTQSVYQAHQFNLIEIEFDDVSRLDQLLPAKLKEYGIEAY
ncbi:glycerol kinase [Vibrio sp. ZSDZ34]|uniref:Glycerol kinase n=1 Tax=Vibrio gelatinilyticus TaxID=2893468 RepID=A0A9X1WB42_9VIBR|nr:glycerol kinase [Vibrio gelatinilyticus]MCJ2377672.1 glycerol kinase [Vibrio gelatinilyticus]